MRIEITYDDGSMQVAEVIDPTWAQWESWRERGFDSVRPTEYIQTIDGYSDMMDAPYSLVSEITAAFAEVVASGEGRTRTSVRRVA